MTLNLPIPNNSNKQPSQELVKLLEELKNNFSSTKKIFEKVVKKAKDEGFTDTEIDSLLYSKLKEIIPRKTLYRYREEFIPLAIDKRNNNSSDNNHEILVSNDTTTNTAEITENEETEIKTTEELKTEMKKHYEEMLKLQARINGVTTTAEEEEQIPVKSWTLTDYEEEHPEIAESPFEAIGEINRKLSSFWTALTKQKNLPTREDDVMKDYIIPARERLKDISNGSSKIERDFLFNWLTWVIMAAKDCRDVFEKADATAYDTRENK